MTEDYDNKIVENYWSKADCSASDKNFYCYPLIRSRSSKLIFGESDASRKDWCEFWTVEKYLKAIIPAKKCLSICCGFGEVERTLARLSVAEEIIGIDIAPGAIEQARERARNEGFNNITYHVADINQEDLPAEEYEIIWANGALHHLRDLDKVVERLTSALKPGGILVSNEYVGPNYQQLTVRQQEIVNAVKHLLPPELRSKVLGADKLASVSWKSKGKAWVSRLVNAHKLRDDIIYEKLWEMPSIEYFMSTDPSECIKSSEIISTLKNHFSDVDVRYFNGSILFYALDRNFYENYNANNPQHSRLLELLFALEDFYVDVGEMQNDNAHIICRKN